MTGGLSGKAGNSEEQEDKDRMCIDCQESEARDGGER